MANQAARTIKVNEKVSLRIVPGVVPGTFAVEKNFKNKMFQHVIVTPKEGDADEIISELTADWKGTIVARNLYHESGRA